MEREQMKSILKEQNFQQSDACSEASCVVQMGQLLAVNKIITGSVGKLGNMYTINIKLIDVASGEIILTQNEDVSGQIEDMILKNAIPKITERVIKEITLGKLNIGYVNVTSAPSGASVIIDKKEYGVTPVKGIELLAGSQKIEVILANYAESEKTVILEKGKS
jgi:hypothetical protein